MADAELEAVAQKILEQEEATDKNKKVSPPESPPETPVQTENVKITESEPTPTVRQGKKLATVKI